MAEVVTRERIKREKGYLYYLGKDGYLWKTPTKLNKSGKKARVGTEKITRQDGYMYFLDQQGRVSRARMRDSAIPLALSGDSFPRDANLVLNALVEEIARIRGFGKDLDSDSEFGVRVSPVTGPSTTPASSLNAFEQLLSGLTEFNRSGGSKGGSKISLIDVTRHDLDGPMATHSFLLTGLPVKMYSGSLSVPLFQSYAFVRIATSGYSGTGPAVYAALNQRLANLGHDLVRQELKVAVDPLRRLFIAYGPTFFVRWPDLVYPPRREWEGEPGDLMADRYSESEVE